MRKPLIAFAALAATVLALVGCAPSSAEPSSSSSSAPTGGEIGFFSVSGQIPLIKQLADDVTAIMAKEGYTVVVHDAAFDPVKQAQQIQQAVDTHSIVGAWVFPVAADTLGPSIKALQDAGIPAVLESSHVNFGFDGPQPGLIFNEPSFAEYGKAIGEEATACATAEGGTETFFLEAPAMAAGTDVVHDEILEAYTADAPIVGTAQAADPATAQTAVSQLLIAHPNADVVIAASDETALGAVGAFKAAGREAKCIIAGGGGPDALAAQEAGDITAVVSIDYGASVETAAEDLLRLLADPSLEGILNPTPIVVIN
jgi:ABC-type sugar transport system substrate-binding protein